MSPQYCAPRMTSWLRFIVSGFLMGTADLVPGVSGGTIALVVGVYERLVSSIREGSSALGALLRWRLDDFRSHLKAVEWAFLLPLVAGIILAVLLLASFLEHQLEENPTAVAAVFFGLVLGSIPIAWRLIKTPTAVHFIIGLVVAATLFFVLELGAAGEVIDPSLIAFFGAGAVAICAWILPGISGSMILLLIGMYSAVIGLINDRDFATFSVFALGAIVGLALFSQVLHWALSRYHDLILSALVGLMAGALRMLWPWPGGAEDPTLGAPGDDWPLALLMMALGLVAVTFIARLAKTRED